MLRTLAGRISVGTVVLLIGASTAYAQCDLYQPVYADRTYRYYFDSSVAQPLRDVFNSAAGAWTGEIHGNTSQYPNYGGNYNNIGLQETTNPDYADFVIYVDPSLDATNNDGLFLRQQNYLGISARALQYDIGYSYYIALHEFGHALYFSQLGSDCCGWSIMAAGCGPYGYTGWLTGSDLWWIDQYYPPPPSWCNPTDCSPIILDFGPKGIELSEPDVQFDLQGTGRVQTFSWPTEASGDAFFALDRDGDGAITNGRELFGNFTPYGWGLDGARAPSGFAALASFDRPENGGNGDGIIDNRDAVFQQLLLWFDVNHDGRSDPTELVSLASAGVRAIELATHSEQRRDRYGNLFKYRSWFYMDNGSSTERRQAFDVFLATLPQHQGDR